MLIPRQIHLQSGVFLHSQSCSFLLFRARAPPNPRKRLHPHSKTSQSQGVAPMRPLQTKHTQPLSQWNNFILAPELGRGGSFLTLGPTHSDRGWGPHLEDGALGGRRPGSDAAQRRPWAIDSKWHPNEWQWAWRGVWLFGTDGKRHQSAQKLFSSQI